MTREQMNEFLTEIYDAKKSGGDIRGIIGEYERMYKYVYIYSDPYVKEILANKDDPTLITDLVNATLGFTGCDHLAAHRESGRQRKATLQGHRGGYSLDAVAAGH